MSFVYAPACECQDVKAELKSPQQPDDDDNICSRTCIEWLNGPGDNFTCNNIGDTCNLSVWYRKTPQGWRYHMRDSLWMENSITVDYISVFHFNLNEWVQLLLKRRPLSASCHEPSLHYSVLPFEAVLKMHILDMTDFIHASCLCIIGCISYHLGEFIFLQKSVLATREWTATAFAFSCHLSFRGEARVMDHVITFMHIFFIVKLCKPECLLDFSTVY